MNRCATIAEFLALKPEFKTYGPQSSGPITVAVQPAPGDVVTLTSLDALPVVETFIADTDFVIGGDVDATATNLAASITSKTLAQAGGVVANTMTVLSNTAGPVSMLGLSTSNATAFVLSAPQLTGGDLWVQAKLDQACNLVNLDCWTSKAWSGHIALTCHYLTLAQGEEAGPVNRSKIDDLETSYGAVGTATKIDADYGTTPCGREYLSLRKTVLFFGLAGRSC